jgi:hypothetical protein
MCCNQKQETIKVKERRRKFVKSGVLVGLVEKAEVQSHVLYLTT